jgi:hypothetical protein
LESHRILEGRSLGDDSPIMAISAAARLTEVSQRFDRSVNRFLIAAQQLSEPTPGGGDLAEAMVDVMVQEKVVRGTLAAARVDEDMTSSLLDIIA